MKKLFVLLLLISLIISISKISSAQSLVEDGMSWSIYWGNYHPLGSSHGTEMYKVFGDTIINFVQYKKLNGCNDTDCVSFGFNSGIRQDSTNKVYQLNYTGSELLLYDFNLNPNDTFIGDCFLGWGGLQYSMVVDTVDSVMIENGEYRKRITFVDYNFNYQVDVWIEGIGSIYGIIYSGFAKCAYDMDFTLLCCKKFNELLYINDYYNTCYIPWTSAEKFETDNDFLLYPNPFSEYFVVSNHGITKIELFDLYGRLVYEKLTDFSEEKYKINPGKIDSGVYFLKSTTDKGVVINKLIKE